MPRSAEELNQAISQTKRNLNPDNDPHKAVWLITLDNEDEGTIAGRVIAAYTGHTQATNDPLPANVFPAARCIFEKTHRIATDEEVADYQAKNEETKKRLDSEEQARKMAMNVNVTQDPELMKVLMIMAQELLNKKAVETEVKPVVEDKKKTGK